MDIFGLICFVWAVVFTIACMNYGVFHWKDFCFWLDWPNMWKNNAKGLLFSPLIIAIMIPLTRYDYAYEEIINTWIRLFITIVGVVFGWFLARLLK